MASYYSQTVVISGERTLHPIRDQAEKKNRNRANKSSITTMDMCISNEVLVCSFVAVWPTTYLINMLAALKAVHLKTHKFPFVICYRYGHIHI